jgi:hypothetical protein
MVAVLLFGLRVAASRSASRGWNERRSSGRVAEGRRVEVREGDAVGSQTLAESTAHPFGGRSARLTRGASNGAVQAGLSLEADRFGEYDAVGGHLGRTLHAIDASTCGSQFTLNASKLLKI